MIVASSVIAVIGIGAWIYSDLQKNKKEKENRLAKRVIEGIVTDANGNPVISAKVSFAQMDEISDRTDVDGRFHLEIDGTGRKYYDLVFSHPQFTVIRKKITVDFEKGEDEIQFGRIALNTLLPPDPEPVNNPARPVTQPPAGVAAGVASNPQTQSGANITLYYDSEDHFCNLNININIGGVTFIPQSNPVVLSGLTPGDQEYTVSGLATCNTGQCNIQKVTREMVNLMSMGDAQKAELLKFFYRVPVVNDGIYYLVFDTEYCIVGILDQVTYSTFRALSF